mgnify:FL=1
MRRRKPNYAVYDEAARVGGSVEWEDIGGVYVIRVQAPIGKHWSDGRVHELKAEERPTSKADKDAMWTDVLGRMQQGLDECDLSNQDCADQTETLID